MHTHTPTPTDARTELARRGRNDLGQKTHKPSNGKAARALAIRTGAFDLGTKALVQLAQAEQPTPAPRKARKAQAPNPFVATPEDLARMVPMTHDLTQVEVPTSIVLANSSARTLACIA